MQAESEITKRRRQLREQKEALLGLQSQRNRTSSPSSASLTPIRRSSTGGRALFSLPSSSIQHPVNVSVDVPPAVLDDGAEPSADHNGSVVQREGIDELMGEDGFIPTLRLLPQADEGSGTADVLQGPEVSGDDDPLVFQHTIESDAASLRKVSAIKFNRKFEDVIFSAHGNRSDEKPGAVQGVVCMWSLDNGQGLLQRSLISSSPITALELLTISPTLVVGGTEDGSVVMWDTRVANSLPISSLAKGASFSTLNFHDRQAVTAVRSTTSSSPYFVTTSAGGHVCKWSLSKPECPVDKTTILDTTGASELGIQCMDLPRSVRLSGNERSAASRTVSMFLGGTDGGVYRVDGNGSTWNLETEYGQHRAPVTSISSHPSGNHSSVLDDTVVTASEDWTVSIWHLRRGDAPVLLRSYDMVSNGVVHDVGWSTQHPTVFCAGDEAGKLSLFDVSGQLSPSSAIQGWELNVPGSTAHSPISSLEWSSNGRNICVGKNDGGLSMWACGPCFATLPDADWMAQFVKSRVGRGT